MNNYRCLALAMLILAVFALSCAAGEDLAPQALPAYAASAAAGAGSAPPGMNISVSAEPAGGWAESYLSVLRSHADRIRQYAGIAAEYADYYDQASFLEVCLHDLTGDGIPELLFQEFGWPEEDEEISPDGDFSSLYLYTCDGDTARCALSLPGFAVEAGDGPSYCIYTTAGELVLDYGNGYDIWLCEYRLRDFSLVSVAEGILRYDDASDYSFRGYLNGLPISQSAYDLYARQRFSARSVLIAGTDSPSDVPESLYTVDEAIRHLQSLSAAATPVRATSVPVSVTPAPTPVRATSVPVRVTPAPTPVRATSVPMPVMTAFPGTTSVPYLYTVPVSSVDATSWIVGRSNPYGYVPSKMLDGRDDTSFQFSTGTTPLGREYIYFTFDQPVRLSQLWIKNGSWKSQSHYLQNCRIRRMAIEFATSGWTYGDRMEVILSDDSTLWDWQRIDLGDRANVMGVRLLVLDAYTGTRYPRDVAIAEVQFKSPNQYGSIAPATSVPMVQTGDVYGLAIDKLATRTGPSTRYAEAGTYSVKGQYIHILSRAYDRANGIWWVECEIPYRNEIRTLWTGYKRFDSSTCPLESIPINEWY